MSAWQLSFNCCMCLYVVVAVVVLDYAVGL